MDLTGRNDFHTQAKIQKEKGLGFSTLLVSSRILLLIFSAPYDTVKTEAVDDSPDDVSIK